MVFYFCAFLTAYLTGLIDNLVNDCALRWYFYLRLPDELARIPVRLQLHGAIYRPDSFVMMLRYCVNLKAIQPGLHISCKDRKHRLENMFFKPSSYGLVSIW